ncbi:MAG: PD-(D/E)XK nuclease domain-containing protein [Bacteroides sp.]
MFKGVGRTPEDALSQIERKRYATLYQASGKKVIGIGVGFNPAKRNIGGWKTKVLREEGER